MEPMAFQETLTAQHRACDAAFVKIEQAAARGDWQGATSALRAFVDETEAHFGFEEGTLFPALEAAAPGARGPTTVMRSEHAQMREMFAGLGEALAARDQDALTETADILLLVMQQHNAKEENVLYPIADRSLSSELLDARGD